MLQKTKAVEFDPSLKAHRDAVRMFFKRRAWVDSPLRFSHNPEYGSVVDQVQEKLVQWYLAREEAKPRKSSAV